MLCESLPCSLSATRIVTLKSDFVCITPYCLVSLSWLREGSASSPRKSSSALAQSYDSDGESRSLLDNVEKRNTTGIIMARRNDNQALMGSLAIER